MAGIIQGKVRNSIDHSEIPNSEVKIQGAFLLNTGSATGKYAAFGSKGSYPLTVNAGGYHPYPPPEESPEMVRIGDVFSVIKDIYLDPL